MFVNIIKTMFPWLLKSLVVVNGGRGGGITEIKFHMTRLGG